MGELKQKIKLRANVELKKIIRKPFRRFINPFESRGPSPVVIHCCYHKIGTVWFGRILRDISAEFGLTFKIGSNYEKIRKFQLYRDADIFLDPGSHVKTDKLPSYIGSHMIRDPRDMIVSGYFYHLWTNEEWANFPMVEYGGMSYKEYLNSLSKDMGLLEEIKRVWFWIPHMVNWNYDNPRIFEIKYEDIISHEEAIFRQMFEHYGFKKTSIDRCCRIAEKYSFKNFKKRKSRNKNHLRSGRAGEWKELFKEEHKKLFKKMYPGAVVALGYEENDNW